MTSRCAQTTPYPVYAATDIVGETLLSARTVLLIQAKVTRHKCGETNPVTRLILCYYKYTACDRLLTLYKSAVKSQ